MMAIRKYTLSTGFMKRRRNDTAVFDPNTRRAPNNPKIAPDAPANTFPDVPVASGDTGNSGEDIDNGEAGASISFSLGPTIQIA